MTQERTADPPRPPVTSNLLGTSYFMAGFESSTHRLADGRRLDLAAATGHDRHARNDYFQLRSLGITTVREALRWHVIERVPGHYDWSSLVTMLEAARQSGTQIVWDLLHFGWPDHIDIWTAAFVDRFEAFVRAAVQVMRDEGADDPLFCPVNEISFLAWGGGEVGYMAPFAVGRGTELKVQLVRAALAAGHALREVYPEAPIVYAEPAIHVLPAPHRPEDGPEAQDKAASQWQAMDMVTGRVMPELDGSAEQVDAVGLNFYPHNQWTLNDSFIPLGHHLYRPFRDIMAEAHQRYGKPVIVAETAAEGTARASWLHYVAGEVRACLGEGIPVGGICLYPITDYPGWDDGRLCRVGLLGLDVVDGWRVLDRELADELRRQIMLLSQLSLRPPLCDGIARPQQSSRRTRSA